MFKSKISLVLALLLTLSFAAGCGFLNKEPSKTPEEMLRTAMLNSQKSTTVTAKINLVGDLVGDNAGVQEKIAFNLNMDEKYDPTDKQNVKLDLDIKGDATVQDKKYNGEIGIKILNKNIYFNLLDYPKDLQEAAPLAAFANRWFYVSSESLGQTTPFYVLDESSMTPEMKQLRDEAQKTNFFKDVKYEGIESVTLGKAYKYTAVMDNEVLYNFIIKASEINKKPLTDDEKTQMKNGLESLSVPVTIWVSTDDEIITQMNGSIKYNDATTKVVVNMNFSVSIDSMGESITVEEPKDAVDLMQAFGAMMGGASNPALTPATK